MCFREIDNIRDIRYEFEKLSSILSTLLQYCRHTLLDDMYCLMSEETLSHLTDMLECKNIQAFEGNAKVYVKLHWIVGNYCYYACTAPSNYFSLMN